MYLDFKQKGILVMDEKISNMTISDWQHAVENSVSVGEGTFNLQIGDDAHVLQSASSIRHACNKAISSVAVKTAPKEGSVATNLTASIHVCNR
jgi:hypothetical protein